MQRWPLPFPGRIYDPRPRTKSRGSQRGWSSAKAAPFCNRLFGACSKSPKDTIHKDGSADLKKCRYRVFTNASSNSCPRTQRRPRWGLERERWRRTRRRREERTEMAELVMREKAWCVVRVLGFNLWMDGGRCLYMLLLCWPSLLCYFFLATDSTTMFPFSMLGFP